ncbi:prepilin-type N-terminal cleavage/methylation domain-containing protein [Pelomonas sp. APW6]|uniref:Prepilin-type N-terminal cleavage/methylation domain-containing protein n=1 Tax=Roseateles subflavus TaxID=3053353 RepID=A0ABT7LJ26_9BURK|nr:prepilin-type N-terminal cleavage/methylation domain-containing protein [Pelomonas sp. APW6]MDL5032869.1 prepilin-type N-terminal cleavage/methylation domain-containing protein [Pelomonas sp. APW6]
MSRSRRGFTLLEVLVVLALLGLAAGVAAPRAMQAMAGAQERGWRNDVMARIESLPARAFLSGQPISMTAEALLRELPPPRDGITLELRQPLRYTALGLAVGGELRLAFDARPAERWRVEPATGRITVTP